MPNINLTQQVNNPFLFETHEVRTAYDENEVWFCAKDVCSALDIQWSGRGNTLRSIPESWVMVSYHETIKGERETVFINEAALYKMIFRSNKPQVESFANWVCSEVLPSIRKTGSYGAITASQQIQLRTQKIKLIEKLNTNDAFIHQSVLTSLRAVCNQLCETMPDIDLLGKDRKQLGLGV